MSEVKFYRCRHCGNLVAVVEDAGPVPVCCGEPMELLVAGSVGAGAEKHVPAVTPEGNVLRA
uniref:desulfoferrodoxin FeS4 iron-binding domain-containing protein n=1 Tax=Paratractidigestivibacter faecalis TaxID=2292441 RepID=UPI003890A581